ncbi:MAG: acyl-CoA desaturase [Actinobacteria bacterium]|nr:acyl-CoA desaturase [Actinomycetota bacterium]
MAQAVQEREQRVPIPGVKLLEGRRAVLQRRLVLAVTVIPFLGFAAAVYSLWGRGLSWVDAGIALFFYVFTGLGITIGFHRFFTHQSFETTPFIRGLLAIAGSMAIEGPVITWVADHRRHHAFADKEGDPHSPHLDEGPGIRGVLKGLWHAHMGWLFNDEQSSARRWAPDMLKVPALVKIDRLFPLWMALTFTLPAIAGFAITGTLSGALTAFLWGSLVRIFILHHITWSINSICHFYGKRPFDGDEFSTNNWALALVSFGESWHNNHHAFPSAAVQGIGKAQPDLSGAVITAMEKVGLARNVTRVSEKQIAAKSKTA